MPFLVEPEAKISTRKSLRAKGFFTDRTAETGKTVRPGGSERRNQKGFFHGKRKKGISLFSGAVSQQLHGEISLNAGMTVEASLVLPLFLFFIFNVLFLIDVIRLQSSVTAALQQTGDKICEYAWYREYVSDGDQGGIQIPQAAGDILSLAYVSGEMRGYLGSGYMNSTCLRGGSGGISYLNSRILSGDDIVEINADYRTRPFIPVLSGPDLSIRSVYYGHAWTGYKVGSGDAGAPGEGDAANEERKVIVAENGVVYHTDPDCVYLKPHVREADASELDHLRANDGSIYHPCEYCHPSPDGKVYITPDGDRYHSSPDCSRIRRTTHEETAEEAQTHLRPCPKCGGNH